jgi:hypothetical protein
MAKNPHAQALGRLGGIAAGRKPLTKAQKEARAKNAAVATAARLAKRNPQPVQK